MDVLRAPVLRPSPWGTFAGGHLFHQTRLRKKGLQCHRLCTKFLFFLQNNQISFNLGYGDIAGHRVLRVDCNELAGYKTHSYALVTLSDKPHLD